MSHPNTTSSDLIVRTANTQGTLGRGTLGRQLVLRVVAIITVLALLIGALSLLAVNQVLVRQLDAQLATVAQREPRPGPGDKNDHTPGANEFGNPIGTIKLEARAGRVVGGVLTETGVVTPSDEVITRLVALPVDGEARTITLDGLGSYRVRAVERGTGAQITGLPLSQVSTVLRRTALLETIVLLTALAAAVLITRAVVVSSLRPLNRVAATAREVSQRQLDRGEVDLPVRVAAADADPSNEVGRVGLALNHLIDNVESALAARQRSETKVRQFVADASHELRNPLASIRGYAELTRRDRDQMPEQASFAMARIESESARMSRLVDDLLLLARLDNDQGVDLAPTDVVEVVLNAVSDARVAGPDHRWNVELPDAEVVALADPHRLTQVMVNLLSNARKHTPAQTAVTTRVTQRDGWAVIEVSDDGPGIPEQVREVVFERFARADAARAHSAEPSTGLGLAIVHAVMAAHGGRVEVDSSPAGATFRLWLPLSSSR